MSATADGSDRQGESAGVGATLLEPRPPLRLEQLGWTLYVACESLFPFWGRRCPNSRSATLQRGRDLSAPPKGVTGHRAATDSRLA